LPARDSNQIRKESDMLTEDAKRAKEEKAKKSGKKAEDKKAEDARKK